MATLELHPAHKIGLDQARLNKINIWMNQYVDEGKLPGALTLVARKGKVALLEATGSRDLDADMPVREDTIFRIYSMTKPITSVALMMLYENGLFQLDDAVSDYIPAFKKMRVHVSDEGADMVTEPARSPVTIHQLLTHTSGLTYGFFNDTPVATLYRDQKTDFDTQGGPLNKVVERLCQLPLEFHPGERWNYGVSTDVLGYLIEVISGQPLDDFLRCNILTPLNMKDTDFKVAANNVNRFSALYSPDKNGGIKLIETPQSSPYVTGVKTLSGGGGLLSTVTDYFRFTELLRRGGEFDGVRLLGRKTVDYMTRNHLPGDLASMGQASFNETTFSGIGFGLGFSVVIDPAATKTLCSKGEYAWGGAASTSFWIDPQEDLTVIFLTQLLPSSTYPKLRRELRVLAAQALI